LLGWVVGRIFGKTIELTMKYSGTESMVSKTQLGGRLKDSGYTISGLFNLISRLAVYAISIALAIRALGFEEITEVSQSIITMTGRVISGVVIFVIGIIVVEALVGFSRRLVGIGTIYSNVAFTAVHLILILAVALTSFSVSGLDMTPALSLLNALSWGFGIGLGFAVSIMVLFAFRYQIAELLGYLAKISQEGKTPKEKKEK